MFAEGFAIAEMVCIVEMPLRGRRVGYPGMARPEKAAAQCYGKASEVLSVQRILASG